MENFLEIIDNEHPSSLLLPFRLRQQFLIDTETRGGNTRIALSSGVHGDRRWGGRRRNGIIRINRIGV